MTTENNTNPTNVPPYKIGFVIDGELVDILHTQDRLAAIFLSNPLIVDVTDELTNDPNGLRPGMKYDPETGKFSNPTPQE